MDNILGLIPRLRFALPWFEKGSYIALTLAVVAYLVLRKIGHQRALLKSLVAFISTEYLIGLCSPSIDALSSHNVRDERYRGFDPSWWVPSLDDLRILSNAGINFWAGFFLTIVIAGAVALGLSRWLLLVPPIFIIGAEGLQWLFPRIGRIAFATADVMNNVFGMIAAFALVAGAYVLALLIKQLRKPAEAD